MKLFQKTTKIGGAPGPGFRYNQGGELSNLSGASGSAHPMKRRKLMKATKRCLSLLLALVLVLSLLPAPAAQAVDYAFTKQPTGGNIAPGGYCKITWKTNFTPKKIDVVAFTSSSDWIGEVVDTLSGTQTSYSMQYEKAASYSSSTEFHIRAYYGTTIWDQQQNSSDTDAAELYDAADGRHPGAELQPNNYLEDELYPDKNRSCRIYIQQRLDRGSCRHTLRHTDLLFHAVRKSGVL